MTLATIREWVANDGLAISFQSMGQYRTALLRAIDETAAPSLPAGEGLTENTLIEIGRTHSIHPDSALPFAREILSRAAPRQPGEVGAAVRCAPEKCHGCHSRCTNNPPDCYAVGGAWERRPATSAQQNEREATPANRVMDAQVLEIAGMHGGVIEGAWTFVGNAGLLRFVRAILAAEHARAAHKVQADAGAVVDAARYRWLRDTYRLCWHAQCLPPSFGFARVIGPGTLDIEIDRAIAAMSREQSGGARG